MRIRLESAVGQLPFPASTVILDPPSTDDDPHNAASREVSGTTTSPHMVRALSTVRASVVITSQDSIFIQLYLVFSRLMVTSYLGPCFLFHYTCRIPG